MSLIRCHKHDVTWDSDIAAECPRCEEVMVDADAPRERSAIDTASPVDGWQPIASAPADTAVIVLTEGQQIFKARHAPYATEEGWAWCVDDGDLYPDCWTDSVCWAANEDNYPSDPPKFWMAIPKFPIASASSSDSRSEPGSVGVNTKEASP